jgi:hypothetical protein
MSSQVTRNLPDKTTDNFFYFNPYTGDGQTFLGGGPKRKEKTLGRPM